jgi:hypothetical protein
MTYRPLVFLILMAHFFLRPSGLLQAQTTLKGNFVVGFDPKDLEGKWFLTESSAGKWKKKKNADATLFYVNQGPQITSELTYRANLKEKKSSAVFLKDKSSRFIPTGNIISRVCARSWYVVALDTDKQWMVVYFSGSLVNREEIQVISRNSTLNENEARQIEKLYEGNYFLHAKTKNMHIVPQNK